MSNFFYDLNRRLAELDKSKDIEVNEAKKSSKPDFLDLDRDGNRREPMKTAAKQTKTTRKIK